MKFIKSAKKDRLFLRYRYAVYERKLTHEGNVAYSRCFIVLKNQYGVIVNFTNYHNYMVTYGNFVYRPLASNTREKLLYICDMLNYVLIDNNETIGVNHVFQINRNMLEIFFRDYALTPRPNGKHRSRQSIEKCVSTVTMFFRKLCREYDGYMAISIDQLYTEKTVYDSRRKSHKKLIPNFQVCGITENKKIFRDIPTKVLDLLLNQAFKYAPDIAFALCVQAFAGLRPGEAMSLRQEKSPLGTGITVTMVDGIAKSVEFDLTREYILRSDEVVCGKIKKERLQKVYPAFIPALATAYERHKKYLNSKDFETAYCPMFVNRDGKAMTYANYDWRFKNLIKNHLRPELLKQEDTECRLYGQLLYENSLGLHSLRHWFSVSLVLMGEDIAQLQYWRGDSNPESALTYLQNKGELMQELSESNERFAELFRNGVANNE